jgi:predicted nucleic acid-binding protein
MTFVDTNVLLDVATDDPGWAAWSIALLEAAAASGPLVINDVVYAEISVRFARIEAVDAFVRRAGLVREPMPRPALFLAGKSFQAYRAKGGRRTGVLPDFLIGAHAAVLDVPLLTRDTGQYGTYFPKLRLITPKP